MDLNEKYVDLIIRPLEQEAYRLKISSYINKFSFNKKKYKKQIDKTDRLLLEYYRKFEDFIKEET